MEFEDLRLDSGKDTPQDRDTSRFPFKLHDFGFRGGQKMSDSPHKIMVKKSHKEIAEFIKNVVEKDSREINNEK